MDAAPETYQLDPEWIDGLSVQNGHLVLSQEGVALLDRVLSSDLADEETSRYVRACHHFHVARKYDAQVMDTLIHHSTRMTSTGGVISMRTRDRRLDHAREVGAAHAEITTVLYVSALEVASLIGSMPPESCNECGQPRYKISERVRTLAGEMAGESVQRYMGGYYPSRSKFLHEGFLLSREDYVGTSMPRLDPSSPTGCVTQIASPDLNLREYTGQILRKVGKELLAGPTDGGDDQLRGDPTDE